MGFFFNGTPAADISITGGLGCPVPSSVQTAIHIKTSANGSPQTVYTVPAGKTFYLFGIMVGGNSKSCYIFEDDGSTLVYELITGAASPNTAFHSTTPIGTYAAGECVKVTCTNFCDYFINGVLV